MGAPVDRSLDHLYPAFAAKVRATLADLEAYCKVHHPDRHPVVTETFRTTQRQQELYAQGRTVPGSKVTNCDGVKLKSKHQSGMAVDIAFAGAPDMWEAPDDLWDYYGHCLRKNGLIWGGNWKTPVDKPHGQWPDSDTASYAEARKWLSQQGLK